MSTPIRDFVVTQNDPSQHRWVTGPAVQEVPLASEQILVEIEKFALTANNITYAIAGHMLGYWKFFPTPKEGEGRIPSWGFGRVVRSEHGAVPTGTRIYGFLPMSSHLVMQPGKITPQGFVDQIEHRRPLHGLYNTYTRLDADPTYAAEYEDMHAIFRPLFTTAFLIDDVLHEEGYFAARRVIALSASSKTAASTAFCTHRREARSVELVGATSAGNVAFVEGLGYYDRVLAYDQLTTLDTDTPTAIVDYAGNGELVATLHRHLGEQVVYNMLIGKSHKDGAQTPPDLPGAAPAMFFAPDQAHKRMEQWGPKEFHGRFMANWSAFREAASAWFQTQRARGEQAVVQAYEDVLAGRLDPSRGHIVTISSS